MNRNVKMAAKADRKQQKIDAGPVSELFPKVAKITINMTYSQTGVLEPLSRIVNFLPGSSAVFRVSCLCSECEEGGFDFNKIIKKMVADHKTASKGKINCENCSAPEFLNVDYTVTIKYHS